MDLNDGQGAGGTEQDAGAGAAGGEGGSGSGDSGSQGGGNQGGGGEASGFFGGAGSGAGEGTGGEGSGGGDNGAASGDNNGTGAGDGGASAEFLAQFSTDRDGDKPSLQDWVKSRGFKSIEDIAKSARDNQAALRDSGRIKVPGEDASDAERAAYAKAIGVPEKAEDYALPELKGEDGKPLLGNDGEPVPINEARLRAIHAIAHRHGVPKGALDATLQELAEADLADMQGQQAELDSKMGELLGKMGDKKAQTMAHMNAAARDLGLTTDEQKALRAALGPERTIEIMGKHGSRLGEDAFVQGDSGRGFRMSAAEAQKTLDERRGNMDWLKKADVPGTSENAEYERLLAQIGQAADRDQARALAS
ncbi:hypothetical protein [Aurantiacibacter zhengii]|uniref:Uncharacterized protein n=1 Tax=Aurantiacibacter zhengii TaxID=2307003 RepID=A0A418NTM0_9SPHN|nr:hypothetical protein [Aurantiacibacter zhengii]RIV87497.1 hypothetical protein D2V07_03865 [Aurantiacibacter zhengii]